MAGKGKRKKKAAMPDLTDAQLAKLTAPRKPLDRVPALLSPERAGTELKKIDAEITAADVGAEGVIAFESAEGDARIHVFASASRADAQQAAGKAADELKKRGGEVMQGTNGVLAFAGHTTGPDPEGRVAHFRLAQLLSAFAGDE
jgi:hypothetical protein